MLSVRDATDRDVPDIVDLVNAFITTTTAEWRDTRWPLEEWGKSFAHHVAAGEPVLVADIDGEFAGFATYGDFRDSQKWPGYRFVVEHTVHVKEKFWHKGVGRLLIESLAKRAKAAGKRIMVAAIDGENVASIRFHERCGFVEVARMPNIGFKLERWLTLVLLQRDLSQDAT